MSTISAYFVPRDKFPVGRFAEKAKIALEKLNIISGFYDEEDQSYAHGGLIMFEYATIHDTDKRQLVPQGSSDGYGARCFQCNADIDDELYDTIDEYYEFREESGKEKDMTDLTLRCTSCSKSMKLQFVKFTQPVEFASQFFQFVEVDGEIPPEIHHRIETALETELNVIYERM